MRCSYEQLLTVLENDEVWSGICDDFTINTPRALAAANLLQSSLVLAPNEYCVWILMPRSSIMFELHTCVLPEGRGKGAIKAGQEMMAWVFANTTAQKLISFVPAWNRKALAFALRSGWKKEGCLEKSFQFNGELHDQTVVGITKEVFSCQQSQQ